MTRKRGTCPNQDSSQFPTSLKKSTSPAVPIHLTKMSASTDQKKIQFPDMIFNGTNFPSWRSRIQNILIREGYLELLTKTADENKFVKNQNRMKNNPEYMIKQENAKGIIFDHLATKYFDKVSSCITVREVLEKLDLQFKSTSKIGLIIARQEFYSLKFSPKGDMMKFLEIFDVKAQEFIDAGGSLDEEEKVHQLASALPFQYDNILEWYEDHLDEQHYEVYTKKVVEKWRRYKNSFSKTDPIAEESFRDRSSKTKDDDSVPDDQPASKIFCKYCHARDHVSDCQKLKNKNSEVTPEVNIPRPNTQKSDVPDWTKFVNTKKTIP